jgi:hypothetical protein
MIGGGPDLAGWQGHRDPGLRRHTANLHAFDLLELNGKELRLLPLGERKAKLALLLIREKITCSRSRHCRRKASPVRLPQNTVSSLLELPSRSL